jgi:hypothetical protein
MGPEHFNFHIYWSYHLCSILGLYNYYSSAQAILIITLDP